MRATTLLKNLLGIKKTRVTGFTFSDGKLELAVRPTTRTPICGRCMRPVRQVHDQRTRQWRHLDFGTVEVHLSYSIRRVLCPRCGVTTETVPWAAPQSWFSYAFEHTVGYLAQSASKTVVAEMLRIGWTTVGGIVRRFVDRHRGLDPLAGLRNIGVDELSYRRHHEYVTVVVDHDRGSIVWAAPGKSAETLRRFFGELGAERTALLESVTLDMSAAYIAAIKEAAPQATMIFDRFHVQRLAHEALDEVRREQVREGTVEERRVLKRSRFALQKNPWNLTTGEGMKLKEVEQANAPVYRAYLLKEALASLLDCRKPHIASRLLAQWEDWAQESNLAPFKRVAKTLAKHREGILAYVRTRFSNGRTEGLNGKARTITRRSYGFHSAHALIAMIFLCCSGLRLTPAHAVPAFH